VYWADTFIFSQLDDFFSFSGEQKETAKKEFRASFLELRKKEFPELANILDGIANEIERGELNEERIEFWSARAIKTLRGAPLRFEPLGQKLIAQQAAQGFSRFDQEFLAQNQKRAKRLLTESDRLKQAKKRIERVVSESIGFLTPEQEKMVEQLLKENPLLLEQESRKFVFEQFQVARLEDKARISFVRRYFQDWDSLQKPEYISARDAYQKKSRAMMVKILEIATNEQKNNLLTNFRKRAAELRSLSAVE